MNNLDLANGLNRSLDQIRQNSPLIHNISNFVTMNWVANTLLALGASPVMAHAEEEIDEMVALSQALVINIGTLDAHWITRMKQAALTAKRLGKPVVLDPVGAGATRFRTQTARELIESGAITILKGNASEILALVGDSGSTKGVDSLRSSEAAIDAAQAISNQFNTVVCVTGRVDWIVDAQSNQRVGIDHGHPIMTEVTGMGCASAGIIGAFVAVEPQGLVASACAMSVMGIAGEQAASDCRGPGSFQASFLDRLNHLDRSNLPTLRTV